MSKKAITREKKPGKKASLREVQEAAPIAPKAAPPAPIGSAQQEAPPPIEGPARAMVIMAHPDDAEFLCSGTVAKWCAEGWEVVYVVVTGGDKGTHDDAVHPEKLAAIREEEQRAACRVLGVKECILLGYPDGFTSESQELRGQITRLLRLHRPDVVITWDGFRGTFNHRDHRNVGVATMDAIFPIVRDRLFYQHHEDEGLGSHQVNEVLLAGAADPDYSVDITEYWEKKVDAILCHTSQVGGRTREDFIRDRAQRDQREPGKPVEERFRRWSIRRPPRPQAEPSQPEQAERSPAEAAAPAEPEKG
jgi:LmbE family N-acetylglucosaminyl deacetylase